MKVSGWHHAPAALILGKESGVHFSGWERGLGRTACLDGFGNEKDPLLQGIEPRFFQPVAQSLFAQPNVLTL